MSVRKHTPPSTFPISHVEGSVEKALPRQHSGRQGCLSVQSWRDCAQHASTQLPRLKTQLPIHKQVSRLWPKERDAHDPGRALTEGNTTSLGSRCSFHPALHRPYKAVMATYKWASCTARSGEGSLLSKSHRLPGQGHFPRLPRRTKANSVMTDNPVPIKLKLQSNIPAEEGS